MATMNDADRITMETCEGTITELGHALNVAMARNPEARAAYERTWGVAWTSIPAIGGENYFDTSDEIDAARAARSTLATVC